MFFSIIDNFRFSGTIPSTVGNWRLAQYADFSENPFSGPIPTEICKLSALCVRVDLNCSCCGGSCILPTLDGFNVLVGPGIVRG